MSEWAHKYATNRWIKIHPDWPGLVTHGSTEPILTVLEVRGFKIKDMFLIGINPDCGSIIVPTRERAEEVKAALEPAYKVTIEQKDHSPDWWANFDRRELDGSVKSHFITDLTLKDGTEVIKDGRGVR
ncbi:hypothetical protein [Streptomyces sp. 5-10]|uniref:hypothetical protein n=1 Tax=Streptomyces sp. 5-10 TaxID=878925 RepID=UPI00168B5F83|nr:hypothetical protein [Streptomyces sp. 5-10]MBD3004756.1 hypothetical protein [Streptomyces sp. 5-10]